MRATGWSNGSPSPTGAGYGLKIGVEERDRHFDRGWSEVSVELPSGESTFVPLSESFWQRCSELRSASIGRWLLAEGLAPWPPGQPPQLELKHLGGSRYRLEAPRRR